MANPIFESTVYRRDIAEARALEGTIGKYFFVEEIVRKILTGAGLDHTRVTLTGPVSVWWASILDFAARSSALEALFVSVQNNLQQPPKDQPMWTAIERVRQVTEANGSLGPMRLLLKGDRPFLGRTTLRGMLSELRNWESAASILVVRGDPDSGRTETQLMINEGRDRGREALVLLDERLSFQSSVKAVWGHAGLPDPPPSLEENSLTTESAALMDFWTDVKIALDKADRFMWVLVDDLDKGAGRDPARKLAEVLAILLRDVSFQQRIRLVLLGYPDPQLPSKVRASLVRNDRTDEVTKIDVSHVRAFIDFCTQAMGKSVADPAAAATDIWNKAKAKTSGDVPYLEALNDELRTWYLGL